MLISNAGPIHQAAADLERVLFPRVRRTVPGTPRAAAGFAPLREHYSCWPPPGAQNPSPVPSDRVERDHPPAARLECGGGRDHQGEQRLCLRPPRSGQSPRTAISSFRRSRRPMALGMTMNGAFGDTWSQMRDIAGGREPRRGRDQRLLPVPCSGLLVGLDPAVETAIGNSVWTRQGFPGAFRLSGHRARELPTPRRRSSISRVPRRPNGSTSGSRARDARSNRGHRSRPGSRPPSSCT